MPFRAPYAAMVRNAKALAHPRGFLLGRQRDRFTAKLAQAEAMSVWKIGRNLGPFPAFGGKLFGDSERPRDRVETKVRADILGSCKLRELEPLALLGFVAVEALDAADYLIEDVTGVKGEALANGEGLVLTLTPLAG